MSYGHSLSLTFTVSGSERKDASDLTGEQVLQAIRDRIDGMSAEEILQEVEATSPIASWEEDQEDQARTRTSNTEGEEF